MESGNVKKKNKLMITVVAIIGAMCLFGAVGLLLYKGYANETSDTETALNKEVELDSVSTLNVDSEGNVDIDNESYYNQVKGFFDETVKFHEATYDDIFMMRVTDSNRERLNQITNDYIIFLQSFNPSPVTDADKILHENVTDAKYDMEQVAYHALQFIHTGEMTHKRLHRDYFVKFKVHVETIKAVEEQYY